MAPQRGQKRPTESRQDSYDGSRPAPHRPGDLGMAQQSRRQPYGHQQNQGMQGQSYQEDRHAGRGGRRPRGGRGGMHQAPYSSNRNGHARDADWKSTPATAEADTVLGSQTAKPESPATSAMPQHPPQIAVVQPVEPASRQQASAPPKSQPFHEPPPPSTPPAAYYYEFLTDDRIQAWHDGGRIAIIEIATTKVGEGDLDSVHMVFQELLRAGLDARLKTTEAGEAIAEVLEQIPAEQREEFETAILDIFSILIDPEIVPNRKLTNPRIRPLLVSTGISPVLMRELLEDKVLECMEVVRDTFNKMFVRKQTNALYRQSNYNLLREETEGYSKLMTELFTTTNSQPPSSEVIEDTFENIKALIGAFDLDAGRVLDVTLDVFANLLVKHYRFFVRLLRKSSWWPAEQTYNGLETEDQGFSSLPLWAQPDYPATRTTDEDLKHLAQIREQRDRAFWDRARSVGMDAFFELGGRRVVGDPNIEEVLNAASVVDDDVRAKETIEWVKSTKTLPPSGNPVAAQLLGFKLRFYASSVRDPNDTLPVNLIWLAALLIKVGFISLRDLHPHLFPDDDAMPALKEKAMKEREEREMAKRPGGGALNALARAGALVDDTLPPSVARLRELPANNTRASTPSRSDPAAHVDAAAPKADEDLKEQLPEPSDQKVELLKSLLCIGAIPEVLYMLGRYPWLIDGFPDLVEHVHRIAHHSLDDIYRQICPLADRDGIRQAAQVPSLDQTAAAKGELRFSDAPQPKVLQWPKIDRKNLEGVDYEFYWHDWSDNVPVCQNVDDIFTLCNTFLNLTGVKIGQDPPLLMKLARIGRHSLAQDSSEANRSRWIELCKRLLAPALSLTGCNPGVVNEMYDLIKFFETPIRYSIYNEWFLGSTSRLLDIDSAFTQAKAETKDVLKRMSKTNVRPMARALAKAACASPGIVFQVVLNQIESYANLIDVVVECGRYFTYMGYDILTWTMLMTLGKAGRSRVSQSTGITTSLWLVSLSQFIGKVFRRYTIMNPLPILQYVLEQLRLDNFVDLQVLRELCITMAGIAPDTDFTDSQVQAMAGGELLQAQTLKQVHDKRHENKASGRRLVRTLYDNKLIGSMFVAIAQQRQMCTFHSNQNQVKAISENVDGVNIVLTQFLDLVRHNMSVKDFEHAIPDVVSLIADFGIDPSIAFNSHRKSIARAIEEYDAIKTSKKKGKSDAPQVNGDVEMTNGAETEKRQALNPGEDLASPSESNEVSGAVAVKADDAPKDTAAAQDEAISDSAAMELSTPVPAQVWHPVLQELMSRLKLALPEDFETTMSLPFFTTFWQLSVNDMMLPTPSYTEEEVRQKERIVAINADRTDLSTAGARKRESEKKHIEEFLVKMKEEMKGRIAKHTQVRARLEKEKQHWFREYLGKSQSLNTALLQDCFLPRAVMSPLDSYFSWRMLNMLHSSGTPGFRTMVFIDMVMRERTLINLMFQCTGREAENLGRFLYELLRELASWHADRAEYEKRAYGPRKTLPGFAKKFTKDGEITELLNFEDFRKLLYKWHTNYSKAARFCIESGEFMHMKNAIACLKATTRVFPVVNFMSVQICKSLEPYLSAKAEFRADVRVLCNSLYGLLKTKKNLMMPQAFRAGGNDDEGLKAKQPSASSASKSPFPESREAKALNAAAVEFQPKASATQVANSGTAGHLPTRTSTNGISKASTTGKKDVEDGELDDVVMTDAAIATLSSATVEVTESSPLPARTKSGNVADEKQLSDIRDKVKASFEAKRQQSQSLAAGSRQESSTGLPALPNTQHQERTSSRSGTPSSTAQHPSSIPPRPSIAHGRGTPSTSEQHSLPDRPDTQPPRKINPRDDHLAPDRPNSRGQHYQDSRGGRGTDLIQRPGENAPRPNGMGPPNRLEGPARGRDVPGDAYRGPSRSDVQHGRDLRPARDLANGRLPSESAPRPDASTGDRSRRDEPAATTNGASLALDSTINPERAALLKQDQSKRMTNDRRAGETPQDRRSRQPSPARNDARSGYDRPARIDPRDDDHPGASARTLPTDSRASSSREHTRDQAPNGPRLGASLRSGIPNDGPPRLSSAMQPPTARPSQERGGPGRFSEPRQPRHQHQDERYGRLNADDNVPTSPPAQREQGARMGQDTNGPPVHPSRRQSISSLASTSAPAPRDRISTPQSTPLAQQAPPTASATPEALGGIHPSRLAAFEPRTARPTPIQTNTQTVQPPSQPPQSPAPSVPPSGPRSAGYRGPESPSAPRNAPAGPADTRGRRENPRRFAGLQDTLASVQSPQPPRTGPSQPQAQGQLPPTPSGPASANTTSTNDNGATIRGLAIAGAAGRAPPQAGRQTQQQGPQQHGPQASQQDLFSGGRRDQQGSGPQAQPQTQVPDQRRSQNSTPAPREPAPPAAVERLRDDRDRDREREPSPRDRGHGDRDRDAQRSGGGRASYRSSREASRSRPDGDAAPAPDTRDAAHEREREHADRRRGAADRDRNYPDRDRDGHDHGRDHGRNLRGSGPPPADAPRESRHRDRPEREGREHRERETRGGDVHERGRGYNGPAGAAGERDVGGGNGRKRAFHEERDEYGDFGAGGGASAGGREMGGVDGRGSLKRPRRGRD